VSFSIVHLSDTHFGGKADVALIEAVEALVPDLDPRCIVLSGDVSQRARHGELQAGRALVRELERTAPVYVVPGNHDVQWWWRPFLPFGAAAKYAKFRSYFGPVLAPTLSFPEAVVAGVVTAHGMAWGSLTPRVRDIAVKGHLRGELSRRMGLARWRQAQRRIAACGADIVLCGHDHQEQADLLERRIVVSCAGTLSRGSRGGRPPVFNRIIVDEEAIHVEFYRWVADRRTFRRSDVHAFTRVRRAEAAPVDAA
jgi:3',5'-cyclic AMP phosphodiesterase CpdA